MGENSLANDRAISALEGIRDALRTLVEQKEQGGEK